MAIPRRIHFYDVSLSRVDNATNTLVPVQDALPAFRHIRSLTPADKPPSRYLFSHDGDARLMEIDVLSPEKIRGRFAAKRLSHLPRIERAGSYRQLILQQGEGLAETRHFVYFPARNLLGIEVNGNAPGISRWCDYVVAQSGGVVEFALADIRLHGDVFDRLTRTRRIAGATIGVYRDKISTIRDLDGPLERALRTIASETNGREIRLSLEIGTRKQDESLDVPWRQRLPEFLRRGSNREALSKLTIRARDPDLGRTRDIDLLEDRFVGYRTVAELADGSVDAQSMYDAIEAVAAELG